MKKIKGNTIATVEVKTTQKNRVGESVETWDPVGSVLGWLDYSTGQNDVNQYNAKIQDTTHIFFCDHSNWIHGQNVTAENSRLVIDGEIYNVLLIDDPMGMHQHLEIFLKYIGGGLGVG